MPHSIKKKVNRDAAIHSTDGSCVDVQAIKRYRQAGKGYNGSSDS